MSTLDAAETIGRSLAALAEVPAALAAVVERLAILETEVAALRGAMPLSLVTPKEAAGSLGVSLSTIRRRIKDGSLPYRRVGRSIRVDLRAVRCPSEAEVIRLAHVAQKAR